ncbi:hypothetical protein MPTK1_8g10650 [Marchantia polymorpha subsp. ruderalis]|uniref:SRR1-like domain-containing protein n=1 Tax=Marchantia polymorpha TaxID=3197 RepID=A0A2R6XMT9_MARPO|nr:hypothetical protein MARPO_0008s0158 [Marchantia polymorpha]BBN19431.1 hypothetical protein Mp_8g10650 [Marchantia polymorpha subsp. ruderalis]|eukprot:PTQ47401.1 hypothetical protein MARPO_0008s0158 [Marchantia polymorpha]
MSMDEWNVVSRKKGAGRRLAAPYLNSSWLQHNARDRGSGNKLGAGDFANAVYEDLGIVDNEEEEEKLLGRVRRAITKVEQSTFFEKFLKQTRELQVVETLLLSAVDGAAPAARIPGNDAKLGVGVAVEGDAAGEGGGDGDGDAEQGGDVDRKVERKPEKEDKGEKKGGGGGPKIEMVLYGVGSIYTAEIARCQLALALLMQRNFRSIGQLLVYDPIMTPIECRVMRSLGCVTLETNENGSRAINGPTLFFMPHNEVDLYDRVVQTCVEPYKLKQIVILGNSFRTYSDRWTMYPLPDGDIPSYLLKVQEFVEEIPVADDFYPSAFSDTSWHFFSNVEARQLH